jgi:hypothetical protein
MRSCKRSSAKPGRRTTAPAPGGHRPRQPMPFLQGDLDGLCGLYAIVNACRYLYGSSLTESVGRELFDVLVRDLATHERRPLNTIAGGIRPRTLQRLIPTAQAFLYDRFSICIKAERLVRLPRPPRTLSAAWRTLTDRFASGSIAILSLMGAKDHWTVAISITPTRLVLLDSDGVADPRRSCATVGRARNRIGLPVSDVILLVRQKPQTRRRSGRQLD